jgi:long-chain fatty acid transport protein
VAKLLASYYIHGGYQVSQKFPISKLTLALITLSAASLTQAAGLDRSGQDIKGFFNPGTYAEVDFAYIDTKVSAYDNAGNPFGITSSEAEYVKGKSTGNATPDPYTFMRYGVKTDVNENISIGVFYDEPFGAEVEYSGDNTFVSRPGDTNLISPTGGSNPDLPEGGPQFIPQSILNPSVSDPNYSKNTSVKVHTESWTGLVGFKSNGFQVYGGPVIQKAKAEVHLRGQAYGPLTGYDANVNADTDYGWVAGLAYSKPEIALSAALTYRSEIDHKTPIGERVPALNNVAKSTFVKKYNQLNPENPITPELAASVSFWA